MSQTYTSIILPTVSPVVKGTVRVDVPFAVASALAVWAFTSLSDASFSAITTITGVLVSNVEVIFAVRVYAVFALSVGAAPFASDTEISESVTYAGVVNVIVFAEMGILLKLLIAEDTVR